MHTLIKFGLILSCILATSCEQEPQLKPLVKDAIILAFGDSLTYGTGADSQQSYPAQLQHLINRTIINAGVPGEISAKGLRRLPALLATHKPNLVILCHGANDILRKFPLDRTTQNLQKMIDLIHEHGAELILLAVPDFNLFLSPADFYEELATKNNLPLLDDTLSGILLNPRLKSDAIHPNNAGYSRISENIASFLKESGAIRQPSN